MVENKTNEISPLSTKTKLMSLVFIRFITKTKQMTLVFEWLKTNLIKTNMLFGLVLDWLKIKQIKLWKLHH